MAILFPPQSNWIARVIVVGIPALILLSLTLALAFDRSTYVTEVNQYIEQPIPFSHQHHVGQLGIDCRYCHTQVERGPVAVIPSAAVCMTCHSQIWKDADVLKPVHQSYETKSPIQWQKVTRVPHYVYFNHSIHIQKGVSCFNCHGDMSAMPLTKLRHAMTMEFCLSCHRAPEKFLRPREEVFRPQPKPLLPQEQERQGLELVKRYHVQKRTDCITCHR